MLYSGAVSGYIKWVKKMSILRVLEWPHAVLETPAKPVELFDAELKSLVSDMYETMADSKGIGLAANQVGVLKRVIVIEIPFEGERYKDAGPSEKWWHNKKFALINPKILHKSGKIRYQEGCLSFPEIYENVDRASEVRLEYFDEAGNLHEIEADGLFAVCIQHEIDHIDGIVFVDRMSRLKSQRVKKKLMRKISPNSSLQDPME